ncbi:hypothetical protein PGB90_008216 [Kerria lacca]
MCELPEKVECKPLRTLNDVLNWKADIMDWSSLVVNLLTRANYCYDGNSFKCHSKCTNSKQILNCSSPKTLLCHDMKGGYLDDRFIEGSTYNFQYLFYHWSVVDIFVYFSHYFITIPPLMWINAAHNHGVKILGTIITEHTQGEEIWNKILTDEDILNTFTDKLIEVCKHYRFDGYLINIENKIDIQLLPKLITFLENFRLKMKNIGILIWYDAVSLVHGQLRWQNELNIHNRKGFEFCDAIFLNYNWTNTNLQNSLLHAGARQFDVYVGIDVFGRGCIGGGGYNTDIALNIIRSFGLSAAIFGFGWTHETQASDLNFFTIERKFWMKLRPYLYIHVPNSVPFKTTFNYGIGTLSNTKILYYNLSSQSFQLSFPSCSNETTKECCVNHCFDDSFLGGSCVLLNKNSKNIETHRILLCNFVCTEESFLRFTVTAKTIYTFSPFQVILIVKNDFQNFTLILDISNEPKLAFYDDSDYSYISYLSMRINSTKKINIDDKGWVSNEFILKFEGTITEINVKINKPTMLGYLSLE